MPDDQIAVRTITRLSEGEKEVWARLIERCVERGWTPADVKRWRVNMLISAPMMQAAGYPGGPDPEWDAEEE